MILGPVILVMQSTASSVLPAVALGRVFILCPTEHLIPEASAITKKDASVPGGKSETVGGKALLSEEGENYG